MGICLAPDDIEAGAYVAVHSLTRNVRRRKRESPTGGSADSTAAIMPIPPGVPLQVLATSLPFVACGIVEPTGDLNGPVLVDLRWVRLCKLSENYVAAIAGFAAIHGEHPAGQLGESHDVEQGVSMNDLSE